MDPIKQFNGRYRPADTVVKIELNDVPIVVTAVTINTEMSEAIMVYSIAVAPPSLAAKRLSNDLMMAFLPQLRDHGIDEFTGAEFLVCNAEFPIKDGTSWERLVAPLIRR